MAKEKPLTKKTAERLLADQTKVIISAVDERLVAMDMRMTAVERRIDGMEKRFDAKLDKLMTTLDAFLKRLTNHEDEFELMKRDMKRMKSALREKFGITID